MENPVSLLPHSLDDGLGVRSFAADAACGGVDVLELAPALASDAAVEQAIRARAARYAGVDRTIIASVCRIDRDGHALRVVADVPDGMRLSQLLADFEFGNEMLTDAALLELAGAVVHVVAALHQLPGSVAHGAICPAHVVITRDGTAVLTDGVFGAAIEALQRNREQLWREFGLALPASASLLRFDQRADVTQLGAVVLALALRRPLRSEEYPRGVGDLVIAATSNGGAPYASALRMWLQQALQLHPRSVFASAVDAQQMFAELATGPSPRRAAIQAVQTLVRRRCGEPKPTLFSNLRAS